MLNDNLVVHFTDYTTREPFLSFVGSNKADDTVIRLIDFAQTSNISNVLRYITEDAAKSIHSSELRLEEDRANYEYIYQVHNLANAKGGKLKSKRQYARRFIHTYPDAHFVQIKLPSKSHHLKIVKLLNRWSENKITDGKSCDLSLESQAISRLLESSDHHQAVLSGVCLNDELIAFSIDEVIHHNHAIAHFIKADRSYKGVSEYLNENIARSLLDKGIKYWNWQQDLNIEGLRVAKLGYLPEMFLKKFNVSLRIS